MRSNQETSAISHFKNGTLNLGIAAISSALEATLERLNREDSWYRHNNSDESQNFLTLSVYLFATLTAVNLGGVVYNYSSGLFKTARQCLRRNDSAAQDNDLEAPFRATR